MGKCAATKGSRVESHKNNKEGSKSMGNCSPARGGDGKNREWLADGKIQTTNAISPMEV